MSRWDRRNKLLSLESTINWVVGKARCLFVIVLLLGFALPVQVNAQDLEPRRWSHLPTDQNIVGLGYGYTEANIFSILP